MPSAIAFRYARSLVDAVMDAAGASSLAFRAESPRDPRSIGVELRQFEQLLKDHSDLQILLTTPAIPASKKSTVLGQITDLAGLQPLARNFLQVLLVHERIPYLGEIAEAYDSLLHERLGIVVAEVRSANALAEDARRELGEALRARTGQQVEMHFSLDPTLIAGLVVQMGSTIYDASVRGQLERLRAGLGAQTEWTAGRPAESISS